MKTQKNKKSKIQRRNIILLILLVYGIVTLANLSNYQFYIQEDKGLILFNSFAIFLNLAFVITIIMAMIKNKKNGNTKKN